MPTIAQLTDDLDDPGFVNHASGATEGFYPYDLLGSAQRKQCNVRTPFYRYSTEDFLLTVQTGTLAQRVEALERALINLLERKLAS